MKKILLLMLGCLILFVSFSLFNPILVSAEPGPAPIRKCTCDNLNTPGTNKNGWTCDDGTKGFCSHKEEACIEDAALVDGVGCKTSVTCGCSADGSKVVCDSPATNQHQEFTCAAPKVCLAGPNFKHVVFNQTVVGADCQYMCTCNTPNKTGNGNNGWKCSNGDTGACEHKEQACVSAPDQIKGVACKSDITCTCNADKSKVVCDSPSTNQHQEFACDSGKVCQVGSNLQHEVFDQMIKGADCQSKVKPTKPQPLPPSPPCKEFDPKDGGCKFVVTAFGDVSTDPAGFITKAFGILFAMVGGIGLLLFMRAGYRMMTSQGKPEAIQQGREEIIAVVVGLLFIIFSFVLLELIGVDILKIPGSVPSAQTNPGSAATCAEAGGYCSLAQPCKGQGGVGQGIKDCTAGTICCVPL